MCQIFWFTDKIAVKNNFILISLSCASVQILKRLYISTLNWDGKYDKHQHQQIFAIINKLAFNSEYHVQAHKAASIAVDYWKL